METGSRPLTDDELTKIRNYFDLIILNDIRDNLPETLKKKRHVLLNLRDVLYFEMGVRAGYRISELTSILWNQVYDFEKSLPRERIVIKKENMKGKKRKRALILGETIHNLIKMLKDCWSTIYQRELKPEDYLFQGCHPQNRRIDNSTIHRRLTRIFKNCKIDDTELSSHSLRKTFAKHVYEKCNNDIVTTASYTGHKKLDSLLHYLRPNQSGVEDFLKG